MDHFLLRLLLTNSSFALTRDLKNFFNGPFPTVRFFLNEMFSWITVWKTLVERGKDSAQTSRAVRYPSHMACMTWRGLTQSPIA